MNQHAQLAITSNSPTGRFRASSPQRAILLRNTAPAGLRDFRDPEARLRYVQTAGSDGWSLATLELQIDADACRRQGRALTNFDTAMAPTDSRAAQEVFKALVDHNQSFLLQLGSGFAFVGRQVPLQIGDQTFIVDLLFYHLKLRCFVVIELKAVAFEPEFVGKVNHYLSAVDDVDSMSAGSGAAPVFQRRQNWKDPAGLRAPATASATRKARK